MQFSETIQAEMHAKGWSIKKFADEIGRTPEHARKISSGRAFPSDELAIRIAEKLQIDPLEFQTQLATDRWEKKYRKKPPQPAHTNLAPIEQFWEKLDPEERDCLVCIANCLLRKRRRAAQ